MQNRQCPADWEQQCGAHEGPHRPLALVKHVKYATPSNRSTETNPHTAAHSVPEVTSPAAEAASPAGKRLLAAAPPAAEAALPPVPEGLSANPAAAEAYHYEEPTCAGPVEESYEQCDFRKGYAPVVTEATLEQVHMLLFIMAVTHILLSMLILLLSTIRLKIWAHANGGPSDDALALAALHSSSVSHLQTATAAAPSKGAVAGKHSGPAVVVVEDGTAPAPVAAADLKVHNWKGRPAKLQGPVDWLREIAVSFLRQLFLGIWSAVGNQEYCLLRATFYHNHDIGLLTSNVARQPSGHVSGGHKHGSHVNGSHTAPPEVELSKLQPGSDTQTGQRDRQVGPADAVKQQQQGQGQPVPNEAAAAAVNPPAGAGPAVVPADAVKQQQPQGLGGSVPKGTAAAGKAVHPPAPAVTATVPGLGLYGPYLLESAERSGSQVVGLGLPMWILMIAFVLLSGAIGWATWLLLILAGGLLLAINTSLIAALRHVTRGGTLRPHSKETWWLRHSKPLLGGIKLLLFFLSFVISNAIYFAGFFGPESCFFSRTGFQRNPVPWYAVMIIDLGLLLSLALVTLPIYTLLMHTMRPDKGLVSELAQRRQQGGESHHSKANHDS
eukprot:GHUV01048859.1.p1 GENE.GHUV01048859.1~~GHUV01048859.1.p1  ORF type:complete len:610 (+),score=193.30 GHUV01048859.1:830-2659(+)